MEDGDSTANLNKRRRYEKRVIGHFIYFGNGFYFLLFLLWVGPKVNTSKTVARNDSKTFLKPLPDLVVEKVWLDAQCQINFQINNSGKGNIPDAEHSASAIKVQYGAKSKEFLLGKMDPNGYLKKPGGLVSLGNHRTVSTRYPASSK